MNWKRKVEIELPAHMDPFAAAADLKASGLVLLVFVSNAHRLLVYYDLRKTMPAEIMEKTGGIVAISPATVNTDFPDGMVEKAQNDLEEFEPDSPAPGDLFYRSAQLILEKVEWYVKAATIKPDDPVVPKMEEENRQNNEALRAVTRQLRKVLGAEIINQAFTK